MHVVCTAEHYPDYLNTFDPAKDHDDDDDDVDSSLATNEHILGEKKTMVHSVTDNDAYNKGYWKSLS